MQPITRSVTGVASSTVVPLDHYIAPFSVGIGCVVTGTVSYTVQHTYDDVWAPTYSAASGVWFAHSTIATKTANFDGNYSAPVTAVRVTIASGTGSVAMTVIQAGIVGG